MKSFSIPNVFVKVRATIPFRVAEYNRKHHKRVNSRNYRLDDHNSKGEVMLRKQLCECPPIATYFTDMSLGGEGPEKAHCPCISYALIIPTVHETSPHD